jgi:hypothetical protein
MKVVMRAVSASMVLVVLALPVKVPQVPSRDAAAERIGTASLSGRVLAADTGAPRREAMVTLSSVELKQIHRTTTDTQGRYEFTALPAGRWVLAAEPGEHRRGYLGTRARSGFGGRLVQLSDGQHARNVDITLERAAAISGRVVDELGEPMADIQVVVLSAGLVDLQAWGASCASDDHGRFRIYGLESGSYYVRASTGFGATGGDETERYLVTYYPGTTNLAEAPKVSLARGQEVTGLEIRLVRGRTFRITGLVLGSDGRPSDRAGIHLVTRQGDGIGGGAATAAAADGTFEVVGVAPGEYWLSARPSGTFLEAKEASNPVKVVVVSADVGNVTLAMTAGVVIEGQIVTDEGAVPTLPVRRLRMTALPESLDMTGGMAPRGDVKDDWTFRIENVRGAVLFRTSGTIGPGWRLRRVLYRGRDITEEAVEFRETTGPQDLKVVVSRHGATLSGQVTDAGGRPVIQRTVVLYPEQPELRSPWSLRVRYGRSDEVGRYRVELLPPGEYLAVAVDAPFSINSVNSAEVFGVLERFSRRVTILEEEKQTLDLRVASIREP